MSEPEDSVSALEVDFVPTCRSLDHCDLILKWHGSRSCAFTRSSSPHKDVLAIPILGFRFAG